MPSRARRLVLALTLCLSVLVATTDAAGPETETPPTLSAASLLPKSILSGPNHTVDDVVHNDGYINIYTLHSPKGDLRVESTALLYTRIHELNAAAAMDKVKVGREFGKSVAASGVSTVKGAVNLLVHPIDTLSSAASGVGKAFGRAADSLQEERPRDDDGAGAELLGYNKAKRDYAKAYGVDPYSRNAVLQASLKRLAGAGFAGGLTGTVAKAAIPGGVGMLVSGAESDRRTPISAGTTTGLKSLKNGQMGTTHSTSRSGCKSGPPAETQYAVEPVGVDTTTPSARRVQISPSPRVNSKAASRAMAPRLTTASLTAVVVKTVDAPRITATSRRMRRATVNSPRNSSVNRSRQSSRPAVVIKPTRPRLMPKSGTPSAPPCLAAESMVPSPPSTRASSGGRAARAPRGDTRGMVLVASTRFTLPPTAAAASRTVFWEAVSLSNDALIPSSLFVSR